MESSRVRRRPSRRRARKQQVKWLVLVGFVVAGLVWGALIYERNQEHTLFTGASERALATVPPSGAPRVDAVAVPQPAGGAKNVILFVGKGYGFAATSATRIYAAGEDGVLATDGFPETALVRTYSRNAQSADAAAAMSAYMTGLKVDNEVVSQTPETRAYDEAGRPNASHFETACPTVGNGKPASTLLERAKASGRAVGVVTTARVTQPIAAAAYAHLCQRDGENAIAVQLVPGGHDGNPRLGTGVDVLLGGGWNHFLPREDQRGSLRKDSRDLVAELRAKGYVPVWRQAELAALSTSPSESSGRVLGLFAPSALAHETERAATTQPSLAEMTARAIELLQRNASGYLLVVESGRIGDALDDATLRHALADGAAFDTAIAAALAKVREADPALRDTMVVVVADHDDALMVVGDAAKTGRSSEARPGVLGALRSTQDPAAVALDASGRPYTTLVTALGRRVKGPRTQAPAVGDLALNDRATRYEGVVEPKGNVGNAGAGDVMLSAIGAAADRFHGTLENTQVFELLREAMGL